MYMSQIESKKEDKIFTMIISKKQLTFLENFSEKNKPLECCAILLGKKNNEQFIIVEIKPMENTDRSEIRFTINNEKLFYLYRESECKNLSVIGIYHTHPSEPYPSKTDIKYMQINPVPWIITSTITKKTKCYIHDEEKGLIDIDLIVMDLS